MRIGVVDSGVGGLTVLRALLDRHPNNEYIYYGDTLHVPYGEKKIEELLEYTKYIFNFFNEKKVDIIVIACGTLSSYKELLVSNIPLYDILSPLNNKLNNYKKISIMATPLSIKKNTFSKYINTNLNLIECPKFVPIIENNNYEYIDIIVNEYLESIKDSDAILLGCTHYPIIKDIIKKHTDKDILTLDSFLVDSINIEDGLINNIELNFSKLNDIIIMNANNILKDYKHIIKEDNNVK